MFQRNVQLPSSGSENKLRKDWTGGKSLTSKCKKKTEAIGDVIRAACLTYSPTLKKRVEDLSEMPVNFYELHEVASQKTVTAVRTSNLTLCLLYGSTQGPGL